MENVVAGEGYPLFLDQDGRLVKSVTGHVDHLEGVVSYVEGHAVLKSNHRDVGNVSLQQLGLLGTKLALILVHTVLTIPFTVFILSVFFRRIPIELEDQAQVDGCTRFQVFYKVVLRMSGASIFATGLFAFMLSYAEFLFAGVLSGGGINALFR